MKLLHAPFGFLKSSKKILLSVAALAMVGGVSPFYTNNVNAIGDDSDVLYTLVGPDYYTYSTLDDFSGRTKTYRIADTSVADFYTDWPCWYQYYCIQGKKIGETEIIVEQDGEEINRIPLVSAELIAPEVEQQYLTGESVTGSYSLNGADNSLISLNEHYYQSYIPYDDIEFVTQPAGPNSFKIDTSKLSSTIYVHTRWYIGEQEIGGDFSYYFYKVDAIDKISHKEENEEIIKNAAFSLMTEMWNNEDFWDAMEDRRDVYGVEMDDGNIVNFYFSNYIEDAEMDIRHTIEMDQKDITTSNQIKDKLAASLPDGVKNITFSAIEVALYSTYSVYHSGGEVNSRVVDGGSYISEETIKEADFVKLSNAVTISLDVSDAEPVASGMTRTWYVAREVDGKVETVSDITYDEKNNKITFSTDTFGNYAYGYVDTKSAPAVPNTGAAPVKVAMTAAATFIPLLTVAFVTTSVRAKKRANNKLAKKHSHFE